MSIWERIRQFFTKKDSKKDDNPKSSTALPKNGCKKAPHPYESVDVDEGGAAIKSEPNKFQKPPQKALRPYDEVDVQPGEEGGGVQVH